MLFKTLLLVEPLLVRACTWPAAAISALMDALCTTQQQPKISQLFFCCLSANWRRALSYSSFIFFRFSCSSFNLCLFRTLFFFPSFLCACRNAIIPARTLPPLEVGLSHLTQFTSWGSPVTPVRGIPCLHTCSVSSGILALEPVNRTEKNLACFFQWIPPPLSNTLRKFVFYAY